MQPSADNTGELLMPSACAPVVGLTLTRSVISGPANAGATSANGTMAEHIASLRMIFLHKYKSSHADGQRARRLPSVETVGKDLIHREHRHEVFQRPADDQPVM